KAAGPTVHAIAVAVGSFPAHRPRRANAQERKPDRLLLAVDGKKKRIFSGGNRTRKRRCLNFDQRVGRDQLPALHQELPGGFALLTELEALGEVGQIGLWVGTGDRPAWIQELEATSPKAGRPARPAPGSFDSPVAAARRRPPRTGLAQPRRAAVVASAAGTE